MKTIIMALICLLFSFKTFSLDLNQSTQLFHQRMIERSPEYYKNAEISLLEEIPAEINNLAIHNYDGLISFATSLNLFAAGFSYELNDDFYEVVNPSGIIIGYTFSITIKKNNVISSIGLYELVRRVDGVFYLGREPAWY